MKRQLRQALLASIFLLCSTGAFAQTNPEGVNAKLSLADKKTTYRIGEPILLVLELTADREGYSTDTIPDGAPIHESVSVSPESGVTRWVDDYLAGGKGFRDYFSYAKLSTAPTSISFYLNDYLRFDRAGRYSIKVTTTRVLAASLSTERSSRVALSTNEITFDVESMSDDEEEKEVKRLSDELAVAHG